MFEDTRRSIPVAKARPKLLPMRMRQPGVYEALAAASLFGAATPLASRLVGSTSPQVLAGLLYLGSGPRVVGVDVAMADPT